jgi:hypothetical protein
MMDLREIGWRSRDLMYLGQDRDQWQTPVDTVQAKPDLRK